MGLNFWQTLTAYLAGVVVGSAITYFLPLVGTMTGTNMTVASSAQFGIRGRFIGSLIVLGTALCFGALTVWTSGDAFAAALERFAGVTVSSPERALVYAAVALAMSVIALYGYRMIIAAMWIVAPLFALLMVVGVAVFWHDFEPGRSTGTYTLGSFWSTWALSAVLSAAGPIASAISFGDYTRRISRARFGDHRVCLWITFAVAIGNILPSLFGAYTAEAFPQLGDSYIGDLVANSAIGFLPIVLLMAIAGGVSQGVVTVYSSGLDLEGIFARLNRVQTTAITALLCTILVYVGVFVFNAVDSVSAFTVLLNVVATPWVTVVLISVIWNRRRGYDNLALHDYARGIRGGTYWFTGGWNVPAVIAWIVGSAFGLMAVNATLYVGPWANAAGGVDISVLGEILITALVYIGINSALYRMPAPRGRSLDDTAPEPITDAV